MKPLTQRPRRLRKNPKVRDMVHEIDLSVQQLVQPYFLATGNDANAKENISGFTNVFRWGIDSLAKEIETDLENGLSQFLLFGSSEHKDATGSEAHRQGNAIAKTAESLKKRFGDSIVLITDVCLCPFTDHGQCGLVKNNEIENDSTLDLLAKMALTHGQAGVDIVAPSDMMDGRVAAIRSTLDEAGLTNVGILSYTAKYASSYYGPFREALESTPKGMDRKSHQMDWRNKKEALRELELDLQEGADMVMVKPALPYLDVISTFAEYSTVPVAAYCVSGEYESVKQMVKAGLADEQTMVLENLTAIKRAGAQIILTYSATDIARKGWTR